jgi:hypothetical protein
MLLRIGFVVLALLPVAIGARSLDVRELYNEMYPLEPVKREAFKICDEADPTFVRAVKFDREACYNSMPHIMVVAMGRVRPTDALTMQALIDPSREAELLMMLAAMPPRQPITELRSFDNTAWIRALSPPCDDKRGMPSASDAPPLGLPPANGRAAALDSAIRNNLPPLPRAAQPTGARRDSLPVISLNGGGAGVAPISAPNAAGGAAATVKSLPAPDIGDSAAPAIVPLPPTTGCGGA